MARIYRGVNFDSAGSGKVQVQKPSGTEILDTGVDNDDLPSHSPDGFQAGYNGSGPAQLAAALLYDAFDAEIANEHYQQYKADVIAQIDTDTWLISEGEIKEWIEYNA